MIWPLKGIKNREGRSVSTKWIVPSWTRTKEFDMYASMRVKENSRNTKRKWIKMRNLSKSERLHHLLVMGNRLTVGWWKIVKILTTMEGSIWTLNKSKSIHVETRKMVNYAQGERSQGKPWWKFEVILTRKSFLRPGYRGERPIEPSSSWFPPKFPSGLLRP